MLFKGICIGILLSLLSFFLYEKLNQKKIDQLKVQANSQSHQFQKSEIEYRDRIKTNTKIVDRWNLERDTIEKIDTIYLRARADIRYLDTSLKKCDTALSNCIALANTHRDLIKALESRKCSKIGLGATAGIGVYSGGGQIVPSLGVTFGLTLKK